MKQANRNFDCKFIVFLSYQSYYEYPLPTYLEYPILIAQVLARFIIMLLLNGWVTATIVYYRRGGKKQE
ncbi:PQ-loop repeat-containing protein 3 [Acipenser ruthenus]|uniref:PQ-loop repeat-containing protein 3 n=1 Tax=Acipenser ruthenus TaxID=7906 RepID=A0A444UPB3_ACIRT|nr:PQ-loop repeat-containing protein 3 [Acipenser ruthenus]